MAHFRIHRRDLLKSAALAALLGPIVRTTMVQAAPQDTKRLITLFTPNGLNFPEGGPSGSETGFRLGDYFQPLEPHRSDLLALTKMHIGGVPYGENTEYGHSSGGMGCLTCTPDEKTGRATGPSIDQFISQKIKEQGLAPLLKAPVFSVGASGKEGTPSFYESSGQPVGLVNNPLTAMTNVFGDLMAGSAQERVNVFKAKKSVLDASWDDCKAYVPALPREGQTLLDYHCTRIRELETNFENLSKFSCAQPQAAFNRVADINVNENERKATHYPVLTDFFWELLEVTLLCDLSRVASFSFGNTAARFNMPWLDIPIIAKVDTGDVNVNDHHSHSHAGTRETVGLFMAWYSTKIAELITRLKTVQPDGSRLFDSTVLLWTTEYGSASHFNGNVANFLFGQGGGAFKTGRHLEFDNDAQASHAMMVSLIQYMGIKGVNQFGHPKGGSGPLTRLVGLT